VVPRNGGRPIPHRGPSSASTSSPSGAVDASRPGCSPQDVPPPRPGRRGTRLERPTRRRTPPFRRKVFMGVCRCHARAPRNVCSTSLSLSRNESDRISVIAVLLERSGGNTSSGPASSARRSPQTHFSGRSGNPTPRSLQELPNSPGPLRSSVVLAQTSRVRPRRRNLRQGSACRSNRSEGRELPVQRPMPSRTSCQTRSGA